MKLLLSIVTLLGIAQLGLSLARPRIVWPTKTLTNGSLVVSATHTQIGKRYFHPTVKPPTATIITVTNETVVTWGEWLAGHSSEEPPEVTAPFPTVNETTSHSVPESTMGGNMTWATATPKNASYSYSSAISTTAATMSDAKPPDLTTPFSSVNETMSHSVPRSTMHGNMTWTTATPKNASFSYSSAVSTSAAITSDAEPHTLTQNASRSTSSGVRPSRSSIASVQTFVDVFTYGGKPYTITYKETLPMISASNQSLVPTPAQTSTKVVTSDADASATVTVATLSISGPTTSRTASMTLTTETNVVYFDGKPYTRTWLLTVTATPIRASTAGPSATRAVTLSGSQQPTPSVAVPTIAGGGSQSSSRAATATLAQNATAPSATASLGRGPLTATVTQAGMTDATLGPNPSTLASLTRSASNGTIPVILPQPANPTNSAQLGEDDHETEQQAYKDDNNRDDDKNDTEDNDKNGDDNADDADDDDDDDCDCGLLDIICRARCSTIFGGVGLPSVPTVDVPESGPVPDLPEVPVPDLPTVPVPQPPPIAPTVPVPQPPPIAPTAPVPLPPPVAPTALVPPVPPTPPVASVPPVSIPTVEPVPPQDPGVNPVEDPEIDPDSPETEKERQCVPTECTQGVTTAALGKRQMDRVYDCEVVAMLTQENKVLVDENNEYIDRLQGMIEQLAETDRKLAKETELRKEAEVCGPGIERYFEECMDKLHKTEDTLRERNSYITQRNADVDQCVGVMKDYEGQIDKLEAKLKEKKTSSSNKRVQELEENNRKQQTEMDELRYSKNERIRDLKTRLAECNAAHAATKLGQDLKQSQFLVSKYKADLAACEASGKYQENQKKESNEKMKKVNEDLRRCQDYKKTCIHAAEYNNDLLIQCRSQLGKGTWLTNLLGG